MMKAIWKKNENIVKVTQNKGNHLESMGTLGDVFLFPEEAVYMVDKGRLSLFLQDEPSKILSLQETYVLLLEEAKVPISHFLVYKNLKDNGYLVFRPNSISSEQSIDSEISNIDINERFPIIYHVWKPMNKKNWSKKNPGLPDFQVIISEDSNFSAQYNWFVKKLANKVSIKLAFYDQGLVTFYDLWFPIDPS